MAQSAQFGDTVKVHYTGKLDNGMVFDTTTHRGPMQVTLGEGKLIPGFERSVVGMIPGSSKIATIAADDGFGPRYTELVTAVDRKQFPPEMDPQVGQQLEISLGDDHTMVVTITNVSEESVTLDGNHPLAGQDLIFDIELLDIV